MISDRMGLPPMISGSRSATSEVDGATTEREFASTDPPTRTQDARVQEPGLSPEISLNPRSHLQYLPPPTPSHFSQNTPSLSCVGYGHVARGSRGRLKSSRCRILAFFFRQRDRSRVRGPRNPGAKGM